MTHGSFNDRREWKEIFLEEIEKALKEKELSEKAFKWVKNEPEAVDAAISRYKAAIDYYDYLIKQAKKQGITLDKKAVYKKILDKNL